MIVIKIFFTDSKCLYEVIMCEFLTKYVRD